MSRFSDAVRSTVQVRANRRCEYCLILDIMTLDGFHVDHIIAQKHRGKDTLDNLAWSCPHCNVNKGSDIASYDEDTGGLTPLFNPRTQPWDEHFELLDGLILGRTPTGRVTVHILQMNEASWLDDRRLLIDLGLW